MKSNTLELLKEHFSKSNWETMNNILGECYQENRYKITLNLLDIFGYDLRTVYMTCYTIRDILESELFNLDVDLQIKYNKNDIIFYLKESNKMNNLLKINFVIPYGKREDYIEFIEEINNNVKPDEVVFIFVNNIPVRLDDVDPNDIIHGLNNFKYCNYKDEKDLKKLIDLLIRETAVEW